MKAPEIIAQTAAAHGIGVAAMLSANRSRQIVRARDEAAWRLREETKASLPTIGRLLNRHHTSILTALQRYSERRA